MRRSILFPLLAITIAGLIYGFYPDARMMGGHSMDHDMMSQTMPENTSEPVTVGDITVSSAWSKAMLPGQSAGGGFMTIENKGSVTDKLLSLTSPVTQNIQIHEMAMEGDVMKMRELPDGLEVPTGGKIELKPGGFHLMFMDMKDGFKEGDKVTVTLKFEKAGDVTIEMPVGPAGK